MAGRRLVDVAKLFNASRSVAQKHVALRSTQYEVYNKTSTLAKAVKSQTDRITLTAAAAIALSKRFSEEAPSYARAAAARAAGTQYDDIIKRGTVARDTPREDTTEGLQKDLRRDQSAQNTTKAAQPKEDLEIKQEDALRRPLPDGTIPSTGPTLEQEKQGQDIPLKRPVPATSEEPNAEDNDARIRQKDDGLEPVQSPESTIPLPKKPVPEPLKTQEEIPEGINTDVFHSKRVARILGSDAFSRKEHLERKSMGRHPLDDRPIAPASPAPHMQSNEGNQRSGVEKPVQHTSSTQRIESITSDLAQNNEPSIQTSQVRFLHIPA